MSQDQATWEDKMFIKSTFPEFYSKTIAEWCPESQLLQQGGGGADAGERNTMVKEEWKNQVLR
jgi:hypothetical protein